ncbi:MAG: hypothetical protein K5765_06890 [Clostridia bacterium]|nr:hypothetical protein [Clostridia bacterium]
MLNLKEKLLSLGIFEDNQYLDFYCDLIESNKNTVKEKSVTQIHHIIPKCIITDNSKQNLVNLKYSDHILAHYYLCLCCNTKKYKYKLENAFMHLTNRTWLLKDFNPKTDLDKFNELYKEWCELDSENKKGQESWNKGKKGTYHLPSHTEEQKKKMSLSQIGNKNHMYGKHGKNHPSSKPVMQFDLQGNFIAEYENTKEAAKLKNYLPSCITVCCNKITSFAYGYIWIFKADYSENLLKERVVVARHYAKSFLSINQYDLNGNLIREWKNSKEIKEKSNFEIGSVFRCCNGKFKQYKGYIWKYKN